LLADVIQFHLQESDALLQFFVGRLLGHRSPSMSQTALAAESFRRKHNI
jgi:hypothetical protein